MQYILSEEEYAQLKGMSKHIEVLQKENEELRKELVKYSSDAYENHKLANSRALQIKMLENQIATLKRNLEGTEAQLETSRSVANELERKLQRAKQKLHQFEKPAGSDFDIDK